MPKIAHIEMKVVLSDDVTIEKRIEWASKALPVIAKLALTLDAQPEVHLGMNEEECMLCKPMLRSMVTRST